MRLPVTGAIPLPLHPFRAALAVLALSASAAASAATQGAGGTVRGTVYDSLARAPLGGAFVTVSGTEVAAFADEQGSFVLRGVPPGRQMVEFTHPALDSAGIGGSSVPVEVADGGAAVVALATPSFERLWRAACRDGAAPPADGAIVFGSVRDAETDERMHGAAVVLSWLALGQGADGRLGAHYPAVRADTDSTGTYYACGVPADAVLSARAYAARSSSGEMEIAVGPRRIARRDFAVSREVVGEGGAATRAGGAADTAAAPLRRGLATLVGVVRDDQGRPLGDALVSVADAAGEARSGADGRFVLRGLPSGTQMAEVRLLGFGAARLPVELRNRDSAAVAVTLQRATVLGAVTVKAPRAARTLLEIEERKKTGWGRIVTEEGLAGRHTVRSVFQEMPSVTVQTVNRGTDFTVLLPAPSLGGNAKCEANVFIDGMRATVAELTALKPEDLLAIEVYVRASQVPAQYQYVAERCGVILAWTRFMR